MKRGRPSSLSRDAILSAAQEIEGDEVSFVTVAASLSVASTSLYHYFSSLSELKSALTEKLITETEFLDDHPLGDFSSYLTRFMTDYRWWLQENSINSSVFKVNFGAVSFETAGNVESLYVRLEDFLETAHAEGINLESAMRIWWAITDFMSRSLTVDLRDEDLDGLHRDMRAVTEKSNPEQFPLIRSYLEQTEGRSVAAGDLYDSMVRIFVDGLISDLETNKRRPQTAD